MKKLLLALMVITLGILAFGTVSVSAAEVIDSGSYWRLEDDGTLYLEESTYDYYWERKWVKDVGYVIYQNIPWYEYSHQIKHLDISENVSYIGTCAFRDVSLSTINVPSIKDWVEIEFATINYSDVYESGEGTANPLYSTGAKLYINGEPLPEKIVIPNTIQFLQNYLFYGCEEIKEVVIPDSVVGIGKLAFYGCSNLKEITIPKNVAKMGYLSFADCNNVDKIYFNSTKLEDILWNDGWVSYRACFFDGSGNEIIFGDGVEHIPECLLMENDNITSVTFPNSLKSIGSGAFWSCDYINVVNYNGDQEEWNAISIGTANGAITDNNKRNDFYYVSLIDESGNKFSTKKQECHSLVDLSEVEDKYEHIIHAYLDKNHTQEYNLELPISQNLTLYLKYVPNKYTSKFVNDDGTLIEETLVDYGSVIVPPDNPTKPATQQYSYTFDDWEGYVEGVTQENREMVFKATYTATVNQYTYKFVDEDETILKEETVDYGTTIIPPEINDKTEYYLFDYWQGYTENMTLTEDVTFKAIFKYKNYSINADGLSEPVIVTYNSGFAIEPQKLDDYHYFIGYFTEENGKGIQITNEKGESLSIYNVVGDLTVYPHFYEGYMNKVELQCVETAMPGDIINQRAIFATDKNATYFIATVKYPKHLNFRSIKGVDFKEATKDSERVVGDYKYLDITCVFDYEGNFAEINKNYVPFEIEFDVATDAPVGACDISIENVMLIGDDTFEITDIKNHTLTILPKLAESIEIIGSAEIDKATQFTTVVSPDYTTDKSVVWSVNDETVATITQDGTVTPVKNGTVIITATAKDGSEVFATKAVNVIAYAKINSLDFGSGVVLTEFNPDVRKYTIYVKEDTTSISLTPTFSGGGVLRPNGSGVWVSGRAKDFELNDVETTITLNRENVTDMTNSVYTIEVIKFEGTKTKVSEDKKSFTITPINVENGKTVILALYENGNLIELQKETYKGEPILFTTTKAYTNAKVMVWNDLTNLKPVCSVEELN